MNLSDSGGVPSTWYPVRTFELGTRHWVLHSGRLHRIEMLSELRLVYYAALEHRCASWLKSGASNDRSSSLRDAPLKRVG